MRIGILTFHFAHNYGAVLQAYAMQRYIESLGHIPEFVDYRPEHLQSMYRVFPPVSDLKGIRKIMRLLSQVLTLPIRYFRYIGFEYFISHYLHLSLKGVSAETIADLNNDVYIVGSDQIWNPKITKGFDDVYFAYFKGKTGVKRIAYAASMGLFSLSEKDQEYLSNRLASFSAISVREKGLKELLQPLVSVDIKSVLDPTFLLDREEWKKIAIIPKVSKRYILVYQVCKDRSVLRIARQIAHQINARIIEITAYPDWKFCFYKKQCVSPEKFLGYFQGAECVVTSSFHGAAFSIIFNKPFYIVDIVSMRDGSNSRLQSLVSSLNLQERYVSPDAVLTYTAIDYSNVNLLLESYCSQSKYFLEHNLIH